MANLRDEAVKEGLPVPGPETPVDDSFVEQLIGDLIVTAEHFVRQVETDVARNRQFLDTTLRHLARQVEYESVLKLAIQVTMSAGGTLPGASQSSFGRRQARLGQFRSGGSGGSGDGPLSFLFGSPRSREGDRAPLLGSGHDTTDEDEEGENRSDMIAMVSLGKSLQKYHSLSESPTPPALDSQSSVPFDVDAARVDPNAQTNRSNPTSVASIWGVVAESHRALLGRVVGRLARNNAMITWYDLPGKLVDPETLTPVAKSAFSIVLPPSAQLDARIRKVVHSLGANLYAVPPGLNAAQLEALIERSVADRESRNETIIATRMALQRALMNVLWGFPRRDHHQLAQISHAERFGSVSSQEQGVNSNVQQSVNLSEWERSSSPLANWTSAIEAERSIIRAQSLAYVDTSSSVASTITLRGWVPTHLLGSLKETLAEIGTRIGSTDIPRPVLEVMKPIRDTSYTSKGTANNSLQSDEDEKEDEFDANLVAQPRAVDGTVLKPPTRFEPNQVADVFQLVVDTYGVPAYKEANPGFFTIVTFPFLFGVMYGDVFHGMFLTLIGAYLLWFAKANAEAIRLGKASLLAKLHPARYLIFFMGLAAVYCGLIYNDCASLPLNLFGSPILEKREALIDSHAPDGTPVVPKQVYPFGFDPGWYHTPFELTFFNSFKMKLSIILGVAHMSFGILLGATNHSFRKHWSSIVLETIPRLVFLWGIFGYMVMIIIIKYATDWSDPEATAISVWDPKLGDYTTVHRQPPSLIQTMIQMFLNPGYVAPEHQLFLGQAFVQQCLLMVSALSVPVLFIGEPIYRRLIHEQHKKDVAAHRALQREREELSYRQQQQPPAALRQISFLGAQAFVPPQEAGDAYLLHAPSGRFGPGGQSRSQARLLHGESGTKRVAEASPHSPYEQLIASSSVQVELGPSADAEAKEEEEEELFAVEEADHLNPRSKHYSFADDLIHQAIHAIEFVLGAVSNTASYLRLWALSLAHAQLAQVFWNKILIEYGVQMGPFATVIAFGAWAGATFAVLCCMDVIECFLHSLRLHWVEFQNKFYSASGHAFVPYILTDAASVSPTGSKQA